MENKLELKKSAGIFEIVEALRTKKGLPSEAPYPYLVGMFDAYISQELREKIISRINEMENK